MAITLQAVLDWITAFAGAVAADKVHLTQLDAAIGDADHGFNMDRGMSAVLAKLSSEPPADIGAALTRVGSTLISNVGGASGPLYGSLFLQMGTATKGQVEVSLADWVAALQRGVDGVVRLGKAQAGDKTMLDTLLPALEALRAAVAAGAPVGSALQQAERAAHAGMLATVPLVAHKGRASYLGERSAGHQDPGATSAHLLLRAAAEVWREA